MDRSDSPSLSPMLWAIRRRFTALERSASSSSDDVASFSESETSVSCTKCLLGCFPPTVGLCADVGAANDSCEVWVPSAGCPCKLGSIEGESIESCWGVGGEPGLRCCWTGVKGVEGACDPLLALWVEGRSGEEEGISSSHDGISYVWRSMEYNEKCTKIRTLCGKKRKSSKTPEVCAAKVAEFERRKSSPKVKNLKSNYLWMFCSETGRRPLADLDAKSETSRNKIFH